MILVQKMQWNQSHACLVSLEVVTLMNLTHQTMPVPTRHASQQSIACKKTQQPARASDNSSTLNSFRSCRRTCSLLDMELTNWARSFSRHLYLESLRNEPTWPNPFDHITCLSGMDPWIQKGGLRLKTFDANSGTLTHLLQSLSHGNRN